MRIGLCQINCAAGEVAANTDKIIKLIETAAAAGCRVVVLPEMADTGYEHQAILTKSSPWNNGPISAIKLAAAQHQIWVACGLSELVAVVEPEHPQEKPVEVRTDAVRFNSLAVVSPAGEVAAVYRKTHLIDVPAMPEPALFVPGSAVGMVEIDGWKVGLTICFDLRFPELYRKLALGGAEIILTIAAWPHVRSEHWQPLLRARAIENQCYIAGVNRAGTDGPITFAGGSVAFDPWGAVLTSAGDAEESMLIFEVSRERIDSVRSGLAVLSCTRPELY